MAYPSPTFVRCPECRKIHTAQFIITCPCGKYRWTLSQYARLSGSNGWVRIEDTKTHDSK